MRKSLLLVLLMLAGGYVSQGQNLLTEGFEGSFPPSGWTRTNAATNTYNSNVNWLQAPPSSGPTPTSHSGSYHAYANTYWISSGTSDLITPSLNFSATGNKVLSFWTYQFTSSGGDSLLVYVNTTASVTGATQIAGLRPSGSASNAWVQYTYTIPASFNGTTNYIIFRAKTNYGYDLFLDDVTVDNLVPCTGTISGGTASASPSPACANTPVTLSDIGYTVGTGMSYQWQSSPASANTWTNITGATTPVYVLASGITAPTDFRFQATCANNSGTGTSNIATVSLNNYVNCYCTPSETYGCSGGDNIHVITLTGVGGTSINQTTACPTGNVNGYTNYTNLAPVKLTQSGTFSGTLSTDYTSEAAAIWIDLNDDAVFSTAERLYTSPGSIAVFSSTTNYSLTIPAAAPLGLHRMRVRMAWLVSSTSIPACGVSTYGFGEIRDYMVNILSSTPPPPLVVTNAPICPGNTLTITATDTAGYPSPTFTLSGPTGTVGPQASGVFSFPNATSANAGNYSVTITSGGFTSSATTVAATIYNKANISAGTITATSTCPAADGSVVITGLTPNLQYDVKYQLGTGPVQTKSAITASAGGTYLLNGLAAGTYTINVVNAGSSNPGNCVSNSITAIIPTPTVPPTPVVTYQPKLCPNTTLQLVVTNPVSGGTYSWTNTPANGWVTTSFTGPSASRANMTAAWNGSYCATVTSAGCVSSPGCVNVTVSAKDPKPTTQNLIQYCQFDVAIPLTATGSPDTFYGPFLYSALSQLPPGAPNVDSSRIGRTIIIPRTDIATGSGQGFVYGVVQNQTCPSDTAYIIVQVKPKPAKPTVPAGAVDLCQFSQAAPLSAGGANIRWFSTPTGGTGSSTAPIPGWDPLESTCRHASLSIL